MSLTQITAFSQTRIKPTGDTACKKKANPKLVITFGTLAILCLSIGIFMPNIAFAGLFNVTDDLSNWALTFISNLFLKPIVKVLLNITSLILNQFNLQGMLTTTFENIIGNGDDTGVYTAVKDVCTVGVQPVAQSILSLVMLLQVVKISQRMDASGTLPALKDLVYLAVYFSIFNFLITNSFSICAAVYEIVNGIIKQIGSPQSMSYVIDLANVTFSIGDIVGVFLFAIIGSLVSLLVLMLSYVMVYLRYIQLYIYAAFSPIPISLMGFEETKQFGINFFKNFVAVCLSGGVMAFGLYIFPYLVASIFQSSNLSSGSGAATTLMIESIAGAGTGWVGSSSFTFLKLIAMVICLGFLMLKSGSIAKDVLGG